MGVPAGGQAAPSLVVVPVVMPASSSVLCNEMACPPSREPVASLQATPQITAVATARGIANETANEAETEAQECKKEVRMAAKTVTIHPASGGWVSP